MTIDQKMEIVRMRLEGMSYVDIAKATGYSWQYVYHFFKQISEMKKERGKKIDPGTWARPRLAEWLSEQGISARVFAERIGVKPCTIYTWFRQGGEIPYYRKGTFLEICDATGIPAHELVRKRGEVREEA